MNNKASIITLILLLALTGIGESLFAFRPAHADMIDIAATTPVLTIQTGVLAAGNSTVTVPIHFEHNQRGVAATAFSIEFDNNCLALDLQNGALKPGAVKFFIPPQFSGSAVYKNDTPGGRIDIVIGDFSTPLATLNDTDSIVTIEFKTTCLPPEGISIVAPVTFSDEPAFSYSDTLGHPLSGHVVDGSVTIKRTLPPATATPVPTAGPTPIVNLAPIAEEDSATTRIPASVTIDVLANDVEPDGDEMTIVGVTQGGIGQVVVNGNGTVTYTPSTTRSGEDRFTYTISDGRGGLASAAVWVTVTPANLSPIAQDDTATTQEDVPVAIDVLNNDTDPDGDDSLLHVVVVGAPAHGTTNLSASGKPLYTPDLNYYGQDSFLYAVADGEGGSDVAMVTVTVLAVDDPPPTMIDSVDLLELSVNEVNGMLEVNWQTRSESDNAGYYVYRTEGVQLRLGLMSMPYFGVWQRISEKIEGQGPSGGIYRFIDDTAEPGILYGYMLVVNASNSSISIFGPSSAVGPAPNDPSTDLLLPLVFVN